MDTSTNYNCPRCGYSTSFKSALIKHLNKKNTCFDNLKSGKTCLEVLKDIKHKKTCNPVLCPHCQTEVEQSSFEKHEVVCRYRVEKEKRACLKLEEQIKQSMEVVIAFEKRDHRIEELENKLKNMTLLIDAYINDRVSIKINDDKTIQIN